jgi:hypothetical protein
MSTDYSRKPVELKEEKCDEVIDEGYESAIEEGRLGEYILEERKPDLMNAVSSIDDKLENKEKQKTEELAEKYYVERVEQGETDLYVPSDIPHIIFSTDVDQQDIAFSSLENMNYSGRMLAVAELNTE